MSREDHGWRRIKRSWNSPSEPQPAPTFDELFPPVGLLTTVLPDPDGSTKQVAWARKVRARKWAGLLKASRKTRLGDVPALAAEAEAGIRWLGGKANSSWWIDRHKLSPAKMWLAVLADPTFRKHFARLPAPAPS